MRLRLKLLLLAVVYRCLLPPARILGWILNWITIRAEFAVAEALLKEEKAKAPTPLTPHFEPSAYPQVKVMCAVCNYQFEVMTPEQLWEVPCPFCDSKSIMLVPTE